jgi:hypothetical protein
MEVGTTDFGRYGLIADGKSSAAIFTATANGAASSGAVTFAINAPTAGGSWFGDATRPAINMLVQIGANIYPILSSSPNGSGWFVTISRPNPANRAENLGLIAGFSSGTAVSFYLRSMVSTASHTMEYAGSGTDYLALPENGGVPNETNESVNLNNGRVWLTSTDQSGKFKVGDTFAVDQQTGFVTIDPQSVATNVVSDLSPELGGDLDVLTRSIYSSVGPVKFVAGGAERVRVDSSGRLLVGTSTSINDYSVFQAVGSNYPAVSIASWGLTFPQIFFTRGRGSQGSPVIVNSGDYLGSINFEASTGSSNVPAAYIQAYVDGTPGANDMPGRLVFSTTADGAASPTERMRITSDGYLRMAASTGGIQFNGDSAAANALNDYEEGTFTPSVLGYTGGGGTPTGTATYTRRAGRYTKIGRMVQFEIDLKWTGGTGSGSIAFGALPFTPNSSTFATVTIAYPNGIAWTAGNWIGAYTDLGSPYIYIDQNPTGGAGAGASSVPYDAAGEIGLTGCYSI